MHGGGVGHGNGVFIFLSAAPRGGAFDRDKSLASGDAYAHGGRWISRQVSLLVVGATGCSRSVRPVGYPIFAFDFQIHDLTNVNRGANIVQLFGLRNGIKSGPLLNIVKPVNCWE